MNCSTAGTAVFALLEGQIAPESTEKRRFSADICCLNQILTNCLSELQFADLGYSQVNYRSITRAARQVSPLSGINRQVGSVRLRFTRVER